jgi:hypothetical protein
MRTHESVLRAARRASGWHASRPAGDDLRGLADLILAVTVGRESNLPDVVHELAVACRHVSVKGAINVMLGDRTRRALRGGPPPPPLAGKTASFHRSYADRSMWEWLACR